MDNNILYRIKDKSFAYNKEYWQERKETRTIQKQKNSF